MLAEILNNIEGAILRYKNLNLSEVSEQSDILRDLGVNLYLLAQERANAKERWLSAYMSATGSNAAREKQADNAVPERDKIRYLYDAATRVETDIRSTLSERKETLNRNV